MHAKNLMVTIKKIDVKCLTSQMLQGQDGISRGRMECVKWKKYIWAELLVIRL